MRIETNEAMLTTQCRALLLLAPLLLLLLLLPLPPLLPLSYLGISSTTTTSTVAELTIDTATKPTSITTAEIATISPPPPTAIAPAAPPPGGGRGGPPPSIARGTAGRAVPSMPPSSNFCAGRRSTSPAYSCRPSPVTPTGCTGCCGGVRRTRTSRGNARCGASGSRADSPRWSSSTGSAGGCDAGIGRAAG